MLKQLIYVSRAAPGIDHAEVRRILATSQRNNRRRDVTGCLLFSGRHFAQVLEGDAGLVGELRRLIALDPRHHEMVLLLEREVRLRRHVGWSMGYLYRLDLVDRLEQLLTAGAGSHDDAVALLDELSTDSVMGAL